MVVVGFVADTVTPANTVVAEGAYDVAGKEHWLMMRSTPDIPTVSILSSVLLQAEPAEKHTFNSALIPAPSIHFHATRTQPHNPFNIETLVVADAFRFHLLLFGGHLHNLYHIHRHDHVCVHANVACAGKLDDGGADGCA